MTNPRTLITAIPATWEMPADLAAAVADRDKALEIYAEANDMLARAKLDARSARDEDRAAVRALARTAGTDAGPQEQAVARALQIATERERITQQALLAADKRVRKQLAAHWPNLARQTAATARAGAQQFVDDLERIKKEHNLALRRLSATLEGFTTLQEATRQAGGMQYEPPAVSHRIHWPAPDLNRVQWFVQEFEQRANLAPRENRDTGASTPPQAD